ncbi:hypothetical protein LJC49_10235 [Ruminococcaceae bacterium OttesenSCG-928-I18]|nr:hypothetical protein [Ruminococcaceae bacterium OttesenSCG-928-I18]
MLEEGYVKTFRSITKWEWYKDGNTFRLFFHLMLTANYENKNHKGHTIKRGQRLVSQEDLALELGLSVQNIKTATKHLKSTDELTVTKIGKCNLITVNNYEKYQALTDNLTANQPLTNYELTTKEESKKAKKARNKDLLSEEETSDSKSVPPGLGIILNDGEYFGVTREQIDRWTELYPAVDITQELRKMAGWCEANPKRRKTRAGAMKFINGWLAKTQDRGGTSIQVAEGGKHDRAGADEQKPKLPGVIRL